MAIRKSKQGAWIGGVWQPNAYIPSGTLPSVPSAGSAGSSAGTHPAITGILGTVDNSAPSGFTGGRLTPTYEELLKSLGSLNGSDFAALLSQLGIKTQDGMSPAQMQDYNKQLLDSMLAAASEKDARDFNIEMRDEQRVWDSPLNQLARLMGAGISRDAALQMLRAGSGSGSGAMVTGAAAPMSTGIPATQSTLNDIQGKTAIAGAVFGGISAISGLVSLGFSVPQAIQQVRFMGNQVNLSNRQLQAYDSASAAFSILNAAGSAAEAFGSATSAASAIKSLAEGGNTDAQQFVANGGLQSLVNNAPFSSPILAKMYRDERSSTDYATRFSKENDLIDAETDFKRVDKDKCLQEIINLGATFDQILAETDYINEQKALAKWNQRLVAAETRKTNSETKSIDLENEYTETLYNTSVDGVNGLQALTARDANAAYVQMKKLIEQKDSKLWEDEINYMASNYQMLSAMNALKHAYYKGGSEFQQANPEFFKMCCAFEECGGWSYIDRMIQINTTDVNMQFGPLKFHSNGPTKLGAIQFYGHTKGGEYKMLYDSWKRGNE